MSAVSSSNDKQQFNMGTFVPGFLADVSSLIALVATGSAWLALLIALAALGFGVVGAVQAWRRRRVAQAVVAVCIIALGSGVIGHAAPQVFGTPADASHAGRVEPTGASSASPTPSSASPSQEGPSSTPDPSESPTPTATGTPSVEPPGAVVGVPAAGSEARDSGLIVARTQNAVYTMDTEADDVKIDGVAAEQAYYSGCKIACDKSETSYVDLSLDRKYATLRGRFGVDYRSQPGSVTIKAISLDGGQQRQLFSETFVIGKGGDREIDVHNVLRLRIVFTGQLGSVHGAIGDPVLFPAGN